MTFQRASTVLVSAAILCSYYNISPLFLSPSTMCYGIQGYWDPGRMVAKSSLAGYLRGCCDCSQTVSLHPYLPVVRDRSCILAKKLATHDPDTDTCDYEYPLKSMNPLILNFGLHGLKQMLVIPVMVYQYNRQQNTSRYNLLKQAKYTQYILFLNSMQVNLCPLNSQSLSVHVLLMHALSSFHVCFQCSPLHGS